MKVYLYHFDVDADVKCVACSADIKKVGGKTSLSNKSLSVFQIEPDSSKQDSFIHHIKGDIFQIIAEERPKFACVSLEEIAKDPLLQAEYADCYQTDGKAIWPHVIFLGQDIDAMTLDAKTGEVTGGLPK